MAKSIVGDLIGKRGIVYAPVNTAGVLFLFSRLLDEFDMLVEEVSADCDYIIARRRVDSVWERVTISLAYRSSDLNSGSKISAELLICWFHDWPECPLKTFELKALFENGMLIDKTDETSVSDEKRSANDSITWDNIPRESGELLKNRGITQQRFEKAVNELDEKIKNSFSKDT